ncbi:trmL, partial [Cucurbita argyrosperma subsp. argyrosperma]
MVRCFQVLTSCFRYVVVKIHNTWAEFRDYFKKQDFSYKQGDYLLFGSETSGLPAEALEDCKNQAFGGGTLRIPMVETYVRCLNLSVSVGIAIYEASRQLNYQQLQLEPEGCTNNNEQSIITEDLFA